MAHYVAMLVNVFFPLSVPSQFSTGLSRSFNRPLLLSPWKEESWINIVMHGWMDRDENIGQSKTHKQRLTFTPLCDCKSLHALSSLTSGHTNHNWQKQTINQPTNKKEQTTGRPPFCRKYFWFCRLGLFAAADKIMNM